MSDRAVCPVCQIEQPLNQDGRIRKHGRPTSCAGSGRPVGVARAELANSQPRHADDPDVPQDTNAPAPPSSDAGGDHA